MKKLFKASVAFLAGEKAFRLTVVLLLAGILGALLLKTVTVHVENSYPDLRLGGGEPLEVRIVGGSVSVDNTVDVSGSVSVDNTVDVKGSVDVDNTVDVCGSVSVDNTVDVKGSVTVDNMPYEPVEVHITR